MAQFKVAFLRTAINEGGYVNDSSDNGGETYKGISRKFHPDWEGWSFIDKNKPLKRGQIIDNPELSNMVKTFYKINYWDKIKGDFYNSQELADEIYDTAINMGVSTSARFLQKSINLLSQDYIKEDGIIGSKTLTAANKTMIRNLLKCLNGFQFMKYADICKEDPSQEKFFKGWLKRVTF